MVLALWSFTAFHLHGHGAIERSRHGEPPDPSRVIVEAWGGDPPQAAQKFPRPLLRPLDESSLGLNQKNGTVWVFGNYPPSRMPMESQMKEK